MTEPDLAEMSELTFRYLTHIGKSPSAIKQGAEGILEFEAWPTASDFFCDWRLTTPREDYEEDAGPFVSDSVAKGFSDLHLNTLRQLGKM